MSLEWLLLGLRILATLILYIFLGVAFYLIWRELKQAENQTGIDPPVNDRLRVIAVDTDQRFAVGQTFLLQPLTLLGRDADNKFVVSYDSVLHQDARLHREKGRWRLENSGGQNGMTLNQTPLSETTTLTHGDLIEVNNVCFRLEIMSEE